MSRIHLLDKQLVRLKPLLSLEDWAGECEERLRLQERAGISPTMRAYRRISMLDGGFLDFRQPYISGDVTSVTLATTAKALYPLANSPGYGTNYWGFPGKKVSIRLFGRATSVATPGNFSFDTYWGTGGDANGTIIVSSAAVAATANQTNMSFYLELFVHVRTLGSAGTLFGTGRAKFNEAIIAADMLIPATAAAASGTMDLTAASIISVQMKRSGSTVETAQIHDMEVIPHS